MQNDATLAFQEIYTGQSGSVHWEGRRVTDEAQFRLFMLKNVKSRMMDDVSAFASDLQSLAVTGLGAQHLERTLNAVPPPKAWEMGEYFVECALTSLANMQVVWPWNDVRDRKAPRASLPGPDLIGLCHADENAFLIFGEVKTSSQALTPPGVMDGMAKQLAQNATHLDRQRSCLQWLHARVPADSDRLSRLFHKAVQRYCNSEGKDIRLVGALVRDTEPSERDLQSKGRWLAQQFENPTRTNLIAWYLPISIAEWPTLWQESEP